MFRTKQSRTEAALEQAQSATAELRASAVDAAAAAAALAKERTLLARQRATPLLHNAADSAREGLAVAKGAAAPALIASAVTAKEVAGDALHEAADRARPKVEAAQSTLVDNVLPKVSAAIATASAALAAGADQAREAAQPHLEQAAAQARETAAVSGHRAHGAYAVLKGDAIAKQRRGKGTWLIAIGLTAAAVAAVAAFRKQKQADDPWATPLDTRTGAGGVGSDAATLKDKAAEQVAHAKDAVSDVASKAKDKAGALAAKGQSAIADAKDRSADAVDNSTEAGAGIGEGEVTAVDPAPDSDAITSEAVEGGTINGASTTDSPRGSAQAKLEQERGDSPS